MFLLWSAGRWMRADIHATKLVKPMLLSRASGILDGAKKEAWWPVRHVAATLLTCPLNSARQTLRDARGVALLPPQVMVSVLLPPSAS